MIFYLFSCLNRTEELRKAQKEANLCALISRSIANGNQENQFIGNVFCLTELDKKVRAIDKKDYFKSDDH